MADWSEPFIARYRAVRVSRRTGEEAGEIGSALSGGTIERNGDTAVKEQASLTFAGSPAVLPDLVRIYLDAEFYATGVRESVPLGTFVPVVGDRTFSGSVAKSASTLYGRLKELDDDCFDRTFQVPAGTRAVEYAAGIARGAGLEVSAEESSYELPETLTYALTTGGDGETGGLTKLGVVNDLLDRAGFSSAATDPMGRVLMRRYAAPAERAPAASWAEGAAARFLRSVTDARDLSGAANYVVAVFEPSSGAEGEQPVAVVGTAADYGPGGELSIAAVGRRITRRETYQQEATQEQADAKAAELLATSRAVVRTLKLTHVYAPGVAVGDAIDFSYPSAGVAGRFAVRTQRITLGTACRTETEARLYER